MSLADDVKSYLAAGLLGVGAFFIFDGLRSYFPDITGINEIVLGLAIAIGGGYILKNVIQT